MGLNYPIKAYHVLHYIQRVKKYVKKLFPFKCGKFADDCKWCVVDIKAILTFLLQEERYQQITEKKLVLRISGDGRHSSKKCHFVIVTLTILLPCDSPELAPDLNYFDAEDCISVALFEGKEQREKVMIFLLLQITN